MTRTSFLALALSLLGCGGGRGSTSACAALATCCASGLPNSASNACAPYTSSTDEDVCSQALAAIQSASYCKNVSTAKGPSASSDGQSCGRYLSCLLAAEPEAYAAALQLYGADSACWSNSAQTAGCNQACDASFADIASQCTCTGDACTVCSAPESGSYSVQRGSATSCGGELQIDEFDITNVAADHTASVVVETGGGAVTFTGVLACAGASTFTVSSIPDDDCVSNIELVVAPTGTEGRFTATLSATFSSQCTGDPTMTCTDTVTVTR